MFVCTFSKEIFGWKDNSMSEKVILQPFQNKLYRLQPFTAGNFLIGVANANPIIHQNVSTYMHINQQGKNNIHAISKYFKNPTSTKLALM